MHAFGCNSEPFAIGPVQLAENWFTNRDFGSILSVFPRKGSKTQSSLNFLQSGPRKFCKSDFSGLAPIRRALSNSRIFQKEFKKKLSGT